MAIFCHTSGSASSQTISPPDRARDPVPRTREATMKIRRVDFYAADWIEGTTELLDDERGVYIQACALIYARGGPIDVDLIKRSCSSHGNTFNRIIDRLVSLGKLLRNGSEIDQKRCGNELDRARKRVAKASQNGAKGNEIRWSAIATRSDAAIANNHHTSISIQQADSLRESSRARGAHPHGA
jgi:uncharacterized protein YdaU (DUF1376 family)